MIMAQEQAILKAVFRSTPDDLSFQLELDNGDGFVHLGHQFALALRIVRRIEPLRHKHLTGIIRVSFDRKGSQGQQTHRITVFQGLHIAMTQ